MGRSRARCESPEGGVCPCACVWRVPGDTVPYEFLTEYIHTRLQVRYSEPRCDNVGRRFLISTLSRRCSVKRRRSAVFARGTDGLVDRAPISYGGSSPREVSAPPCPARGLSPWPFVPPVLDRPAVRAGATTNRGAHRDTPTRTRTRKSGTVKARALPSLGASGVSAHLASNTHCSISSKLLTHRLPADPRS